VPGTQAHRRQLEWMTSYLAARADSVFTQPFEHTTGAGTRLTMTNVVARFNLEARDRLLFAAHWDTRPIADQDPDSAFRKQPIPGANDGASGVAVLMELANVLSRHVPPIGVDLVFFDGEDYGPDEMYLGAEHFAANLPPGYQPLYGILLDMVGDQHPVFLQEAFSRQDAPEVVARVWNVAEQMGYGDVFRRQQGMAIQDDHIPLNRAGIRTIDVIDFDYGPDNHYWHTHLDDLQHVAPVGLGVVGNVLLRLVFLGG
jgi:glutaminyl-peptide cyclotransferase